MSNAPEMVWIDTDLMSEYEGQDQHMGAYTYPFPTAVEYTRTPTWRPAAEVTEPGWYWYRHEDGQVCVDRVERMEDGRLGVDVAFDHCPIDELDGYFAGPLTPPAQEETP